MRKYSKILRIVRSGKRKNTNYLIRKHIFILKGTKFIFRKIYKQKIPFNKLEEIIQFAWCLVEKYHP